MKTLLIVIFVCFVCVFTKGQNTTKPAYRIERHKVHSGYHTNNKLSKSSNNILAYNMEINIPEAKWLRLVFNEFNLGKESFIKIKSLKDNSVQVHRQKSLNEWQRKSAAFNGGKLQIELYVQGSDRDVFFSIDSVIVGIRNQNIYGPEALCGADNRVGSNDGRVGRLPVARLSDFGWCTVWLVSNGAILTAAHCADNDGNGTLDLLAGDFIEFNVPASNEDGTVNFAAAQDQYPIDVNNIVIPNGWQQGADWGIIRCFPNANTGLLPHQAQGDFFRMTRENPQVNSTLRVTGYGLDDDPAGPGPCVWLSGSCRFLNNTNATQQTSVGAYAGESSSGNRFWHLYSVDTEPANSGSPIIWDGNNNFTIGIHTNGGCNTIGNNSGTSFEHDPLESALQDFHGGNTRYVDLISVSLNENGTIFSPFNTIQEGVNSVSNGGRLFITTGIYNGNAGLIINKAVIILPPSTGVININP